MEVEEKKTGGGRKILGMRLQWEGHVDGETILYGYSMVKRPLAPITILCVLIQCLPWISVIFQNHVTCVTSSLTTCNTSRLQTDVNSTRVLNSSVMRMMFLLFTEP